MLLLTWGLLSFLIVQMSPAPAHGQLSAQLQLLARVLDQRHVSRVPHSGPQTDEREEKCHFCPEQSSGVTVTVLPDLAPADSALNWIKRKTDCLQTLQGCVVLWIKLNVQTLRVIRSDQVWIIDRDTSEMLLLRRADHTTAGNSTTSSRPCNL